MKMLQHFRMAILFYIVTLLGRSPGAVPTLRKGDEIYRGVSSLLSATREPENLVYEIPGFRDQQII